VTRFQSVVAFLLSLVPADAIAQASDSTRADSAQKLKTVTVSGSRSVGIVGGSSAVVVKPMELRSSPAPLLDQALRESPFVHVRLNSRGEMELSIRGSDSRQAAVMLDGVPITIGWDHRTDPSIIPITGADKLTIVRGLGSVASFNSASHGAGRRMSRSAAKRAFTVQDLIEQTAGVESRKDAGVVDEIPAAYKDVHAVMAAQAALVEVVAQLRQLVCVKG